MSRPLQVLGTAVVVGLLASFAAQAQPFSYGYNGPAETPAQNVQQSARYDRLLETNPRFRTYRMRRECSPISFIPGLRQDCFATFERYEPMMRRPIYRRRPRLYR
jgi:hypothetical protein